MFKHITNWIKPFFVIFFAICITILLIFTVGCSIYTTFIRTDSSNNFQSQWGGYCPISVYQIYDKDTGVYYAVTDHGGICPMYTIEGEVKLVDQGNEYVIHKNLGEPNAQE